MAATIRLEWAELDTLMVAMDCLDAMRPADENLKAETHRTNIRTALSQAKDRAYQKVNFSNG